MPAQQNWQQGYQQGGWQAAEPQQYTPPVYQPVNPVTPNEQRGVEDVGRKERVRHVWLMALLITGIVAVLAVGGYLGWQLWQERQHDLLVEATITPYNSLYCENVFVDGIALGGMTQEEAWQTVSANASSLHSAWSVKLTYQGETIQEISASDLNMRVDVESTLREAWNAGHTGDNDARYETMLALQAEPLQLYTTAPATNTAQLDAILSMVAERIYRAPQDAVFLSFNAQLTNPFSFQQEVTGLVLDTDEIKTRLYEMVSSSQSGTIELQPTEIAPSVTVAQLTEQFATLRGSATTPISNTSTENRNSNIKRAFELISGTVIQPGRDFSFNRIVGERTISNGFLEADEYVYEAVQPGIGGGVCQASSTVYVAAVRAGLKIVSREPHSMAVRYTSYGKDATVYWYSNHKIDLVFRNNTDQPIYIKAAVQSDPNNRKRLVCNVYIYGQSLGDVSYDILTEETPIDPPSETKYVKDRKGEYVTYIGEEKVVQEAAKGASVDSFRVRYEGGVEVSREKLYTDIYKPKQKTVYQGTQTRK